jgi:rhamnogalacturonyl hydrolase YesR
MKDIQASVDLMVNSDKISDWNWIDALQMAMLVFARLTRITGDKKYSERMFRMSKNYRI